MEEAVVSAAAATYFFFSREKSIKLFRMRERGRDTQNIKERESERAREDWTRRICILM